MPAIRNPLTGSGGYVIGTFTTATRRPALLKRIHNVSALTAPPFMMWKRPELPSPTKSKIPCLPGFIPVIKETQAGGLRGCNVEVSRPHAPLDIKRCRLGNAPAFRSGSITSKVAASSPITAVLYRCAIRYLPNGQQTAIERCFDRHANHL